ncbi:MAG: diguanylate cyclase [Lachnospiraceae bacterium]|nr:diguanylate cyclase [Lachnospiraceae bacterium]
MSGYIVVYLEILFLCFVTAAILRSKVSHDLGTEAEVKAFRLILSIYMVMMVLDSFTQLQYQGEMYPPVITVALAQAAYMSLLAVLAVVWFLFAELQIDPALTRTPLFRALFALPGVLMVFMCFASLRTGWVFYYDEAEVFRRGPFFFLQNVIAYAYFLVTAIHSVYAAGKEVSVSKKQRLRKISFFIIAPTIGGLLQLFIGGYPFVGPSIIISVLFIFTSVQADMINIDSLTGLNNRKTMERYLEELLADFSNDTRYFLFLIDVDRFKSINDTYGHIEGDRALRCIADAMRLTTDSYGGFVARLGGDEFVAVAEVNRVGSPSLFSDTLAKNLNTIKERNRLPYTLAASVGYAICPDQGRLPGDLLIIADQMMYLVKRQRKQSAAS